MKATVYTNNPSSSDLSPKGDGTLNKAAMGAHNVVDKVAGAAGDMARGTIPAIDRTAHFAHTAVDQAVAGATPAAEWIDEQAGALNAARKKLVGNTREYVAANPLQSLGIALAAGFLVSWIVRK